MQTLSIDGFGSGLRADDSHGSIPEDAASECLNVIFNRRSVQTRPGRVAHSAFPATNGCRSLGKWQPQSSSGYLRILAAMGTAVECTDTSGQSFSTHVTLNIAATGQTMHATNRIRFAQLGAYYYFVDGSGWPIRGRFPSGSESTVELLDTFDMEAAPTVVGNTDSGGGGGSYIPAGTYQFCLGITRDLVSTTAWGEPVSIRVPDSTYYSLVVTVPDVEAWADWAAGDRVRVYARNSNSDYPDKWVRHTTTDPATSPYWQTGVGQGVTFYEGVAPGTDSVTHVARNASGVATYTTAAAHGLVAGQAVNLPAVGFTSPPDPVGFNGYYVVRSVPTPTTFTATNAGAAVVTTALAAPVTATMQVQMAFDTTSTGADDYIPGPPKGATIVCEWGNRMVYVAPAPYSTNAADTLYISNLLDPTLVPWTPVVNAPEDYGTYIQVGSDGEAITGVIAGPGSLLTVAKRNSLWVVDGEGWASYRCLQVAGNYGCVSHESLVNKAGRLIGFDGNSVWGFDGSEPRSLSDKKIDTLFAEHTEAEKALAFAVYDPAQQWYVLWIPNTANEAVSDAYALDLHTGEWTHWNAQPGGAAIYCQNAGTPGTYACDQTPETAGDTLDLYRMFAGEDDNDEAIKAEWWSKEFREPGRRHYKDIQRVVAWVRCPDPAKTTLRLAIRANGSEFDTANSTDLDPLPGAGEPKALRWRPPALGDVARYRVGAAWEGTSVLEISELDFDVLQRGPVA